MEYDAENEHFELRLHVFTDDLELAMEEEGLDRYYINTKFEKHNADSAILVYLKRHLALTDRDGRKASIKWLGKEPSDDLQATLVYFYWIPEEKGKTEFYVDSDLFLNIYDDQQNIIQFDHQFGRQMDLLYKEKRRMKINLDD